MSTEVFSARLLTSCWVLYFSVRWHIYRTFADVTCLTPLPPPPPPQPPPCRTHTLYPTKSSSTQILDAMSLKHNDLISLPEFLAAFSHVPFHEISDQMDVIGSCSAHFVAVLYETMGILKPEAVGERVVLPSSFCEASTRKRNTFTSTGQISMESGARFGKHQMVMLT